VLVLPPPPELEPLLPDLELGFHLSLAQVQGGVALLELLGTAGEYLLALVEPLLLTLVAAARGEDRLLRLVEGGLTRRKVVVPLLQASLRELVDLGVACLLGCSPGGCLQAMELGLARNQLGLAVLDAVELGECVLGNRVAVRGLALEVLHARRQLAGPGGALLSKRRARVGHGAAQLSGLAGRSRGSS